MRHVLHPVQSCTISGSKHSTWWCLPRPHMGPWCLVLPTHSAACECASTCSRGYAGWRPLALRSTQSDAKPAIRWKPLSWSLCPVWTCLMDGAYIFVILVVDDLSKPSNPKSAIPNLLASFWMRILRNTPRLLNTSKQVDDHGQQPWSPKSQGLHHPEPLSSEDLHNYNLRRPTWNIPVISPDPMLPGGLATHRLQESLYESVGRLWFSARQPRFCLWDCGQDWRFVILRGLRAIRCICPKRTETIRKAACGCGASRARVWE